MGSIINLNISPTQAEEGLSRATVKTPVTKFYRRGLSGYEPQRQPFLRERRVSVDWETENDFLRRIGLQIALFLPRSNGL